MPEPDTTAPTTDQGEAPRRRRARGGWMTATDVTRAPRTIAGEISRACAFHFTGPRIPEGLPGGCGA